MVTRVQPSPFEKSTWRSRSSEWLDKHQKLVSGFLAVAAGVLSCCLNAAPLPVSIVSVASIAEMLASNSFKTAQSVKHDTSFPQSHATSAEVGVSRPPARRASGTEGLRYGGPPAVENDFPQLPVLEAGPLDTSEVKPHSYPPRRPAPAPCPPTCCSPARPRHTSRAAGRLLPATRCSRPRARRPPT